jgi:ketosteroid isomerase-like protein
MMTNDLKDFRKFMKQREGAAQSYVEGDAAPLSEIVTHTSKATFFGPDGGHVEGAKAVESRYARDAETFEGGGKNRMEILQMEASGDLAFWVGFQIAEAHLKGKKHAVPMKLRVSEVFHRENDSWKLLHRHADMVKEQSAATH